MFRSISTLLKKKFEFHKPLKREYIIIEKSNLKEFLSIIKKNKVYLVNFNNSINFYVLISLIIKLKKINQLNYFLESIILSNPKIILTAIDSNPNFYKLKKYFPEKIFISVQNGIRTDLSFEKKNENLKSDLIFCNGISDVKFFKSRIKSKIIPFGTIKNNSVNNKIKTKKNCLSYISVYRDIDVNRKKINFLGKFDFISWGEYIESEKLLIKSLYYYCQKNKIKFNIVGCNYDYFKEKKWYEEVVGSHKINLIPRSSSTSSYDFLKKSKYIVSMDSTLGYEFLSRGSRIVFFSRKIKETKKLTEICNFGAPYNRKKKGLFFSNEINYKEIERLLNNLRNHSKKNWLKKINKIKKQLMLYDFNNKIFKKEISKINRFY